MAFGISKCVTFYQRLIRKLYQREFGGIVILNINKDLLDKTQKSVLLCYTVNQFEINFNGRITHANMFHVIQMIKVLIGRNYSIDVCKAKSVYDIEKLKQSYDYIIGFGPLYEALIRKGIKGHKILLLTENDPYAVETKYSERIDYFKQRHGANLIKGNKRRNSFYSLYQVDNSEACIGMNSSFNLSRIQTLMNLYKIKVNAISNENYIYKEKDFNKIRNNFVWFGSAGVIHKGLDILVDAFAQLPEYTLSVYGLPQSELSVIKSFLPSNVHICGSIDVRTDSFIQEVVNKNSYVISASCSEGMNTGVATCMMHGLIPVITKETGFDNPGFIKEFEDYKVDYIVSFIKDLANISDVELGKLSKEVYSYSQKAFSLENFTKEFETIIKDIESEYE